MRAICPRPRPGRDVYRSVMFASATELPFADAAFNTVISNCVIEHIPDNDAVLSEICRVLRPGGVFATTLPSEHYPEYLLGSQRPFGRWACLVWAHAYGRFFNRISHHYHVYSPAGLARAVERGRICGRGTDLLLLGGRSPALRSEPLPGRAEPGHQTPLRTVGAVRWAAEGVRALAAALL